jgi:acyl-CoA thioester hydrolase
MAAGQEVKPGSDELRLAVRDYECDLQGIVNNAVYLNYLEHARHEYLRSRGIDFADCHRRGIELVVARVRIDYKRSLISGGEFVVQSRVERQNKVKFVFFQDIYSLPDRQLAVRARTTSVCKVNGSLAAPEEIVLRLAGRAPGPSAPGVDCPDAG